MTDMPLGTKAIYRRGADHVKCRCLTCGAWFDVRSSTIYILQTSIFARTKCDLCCESRSEAFNKNWKPVQLISNNSDFWYFG